MNCKLCISNSNGRYKNPNTISTGNKFIDKNIAKYGAKAVGTVVKIPKGKIVVKAAEKAYPYIEKGSANIARAKTAYIEVCKKKIVDYEE